MARPLFVLGFDAMDIELVRGWVSAGLLPTFRDLLNTSAWCTFDIPPEYSSGMVWPSINTGLPPEEHGSGFGTRLIGGRYKLRPRQSADIRGDPFWKGFTAAGRRIVIADIPFSRVIPECAGRQVWGWGQHDWTGEPASYPPGLLSELQSRVGRYPLRYSMDYSLHTSSLRELREDLFTAIERRTQLLGTLLQAGKWDLFYAAFPESHIAGHLFWHLNDRAHPAFSSRQLAQLGNALQDTYIRLDRALAQLLQRVGPDATKVIFFSHGIGPNYHGDHLFSELLWRFNARQGDTAQPRDTSSLIERLWKPTIGALPESLRRSVKIRLPLNARRWLSAKRAENPTRWRTARSFAIPRLDGFSAVRVNLRGREPHGRIEAGEGYRRYLSELESEMRSWTNGETGRPVVERIYRADEYGAAPAAGTTPDLMLWWSKAAPVRVIHSARLGRVAGRLAEHKSGEHIMRSLFLVQSAEFTAGRRQVSAMQPTDIAPTLSELAGIEAVESYRGRSRCEELLALGEPVRFAGRSPG